MSSKDHREHQIRLAAFEWLDQQVALHGDVLPRDILRHGFPFEDERISLLSQQGIFKPRQFEILPLSITTTIAGPYNDSFSEEGLLRYRYRGTDPQHRDNVGLRLAKDRRIPLVYFHAVIKGRYLAVWPVFIVADHPETLTFSVAVDDARFVDIETAADWDTLRIADGTVDESRRAYITAAVRQRLHQRSFREKVLQAYRDQCAFCRLEHRELLDAAHIVPDSDEAGEPVVTNGLALCKLHHAAFDRLFLGVRPDYRIEVRPDILKEKDGPVLLHGLQGLHERRIIIPRRKVQQPDPERLSRRYEKFRAAC